MAIRALHQKWRFPSDHLPVGICFNQYKLVTWNVLNSAYIHYLEADDEGLTESQIFALHNQSAGGGLSRREKVIVDMILDLIKREWDILCLQECGMTFLTHLRRALPRDYQLVSLNRNSFVENDTITLFSTKTFRMIRDHCTYYAINKGKSIVNCLLESHQSPQQYQIINTHLPGAPNLETTIPGTIARYAKEQRSINAISMLVGDMNFGEETMIQAFQRTGLFAYKNYSFYNTIIGKDRVPKKIDHIFIDSHSKKFNCKPCPPNDIFPSLEDLIQLLSL